MEATTEAGEVIFVSAISLVDLTYLVEKGRVPAAALRKLRKALADPDSGVVIADVGLAVADAISQIPRESVPDLPDSVIAVTAISLQDPLVSRDRKIQAAGLRTIW